MAVSEYWNSEKILKNKKKINSIFFYRICGMGMGTAALLMQEAGYVVAGADNAFYPPMGNFLNDKNMKCYHTKDVTSGLLASYDLVVVGNTVNGKGEEAQLIVSAGIAYTSFPSLIGSLILKDRCVVGVAGTHGKTTTSYYLAQTLKNLGEDVGYLVGGVTPDGKPSHLGTSPYFIIESDEYDSCFFEKFSKFRLYEIDHLLLTSVEFDHADIFQSVEDIEQQFYEITPRLSSLIYSSDYESSQKIALDYSRRTQRSYPLSYGFSSSIGPKNIEVSQGQTTFDLVIEGVNHHFQTSIIGKQNILNLTACILFCQSEGFSITKIRQAIRKLKNVKRRQEYRGRYDKLHVIDDFAHHPTSVELTLDSLISTYPNKEVYVAFEAVTATARSSAFQQNFISVFQGAKKVYVLNPRMQTNASQFNNMNYTQLTCDINSSGIEAIECKDLDSLRSEIEKIAHYDALFVVFTNRTALGLWECQEFTKKLQ